MKKLLLIFAHPGDESFAAGGTIAKYAKAGWEIHIICATSGEAGPRGQYTYRKKEELGNIRLHELNTAGKVLGIGAVETLGYPDGKLKSVHFGELEDKLFRSMISISPDIVITFEPNGISNHPDNMRMSLSVTYAYQKFAHARIDVLKEGVSRQKPQRHARDSWQMAFADTVRNKTEPKLYYACQPQSVVEYLVKKRVLPEKSFEKPRTGVEDKKITTVIDVRRFTAVKIRALQEHVSQKSDVDRYISVPNNPLLQNEYFILRMWGITEVYMGKNDHVENRL